MTLVPIPEDLEVSDKRFADTCALVRDPKGKAPEVIRKVACEVCKILVIRCWLCGKLFAVTYTVSDLRILRSQEHNVADLCKGTQ